MASRCAATACPASSASASANTNPPDADLTCGACRVRSARSGMLERAQGVNRGLKPRWKPPSGRLWIVMAYIILIIVLAVLIVAIGGTLLLRPRGTRGAPRRGADFDSGGGTGTTTESRPGTAAGEGTITAPPPQ